MNDLRDAAWLLLLMILICACTLIDAVIWVLTIPLRATSSLKHRIRKSGDEPEGALL